MFSGINHLIKYFVYIFRLLIIHLTTGPSLRLLSLNRLAIGELFQVRMSGRVRPWALRMFPHTFASTLTRYGLIIISMRVKMNMWIYPYIMHISVLTRHFLSRVILDGSTIMHLFALLLSGFTGPKPPPVFSLTISVPSFPYLLFHWLLLWYVWSHIVV